MRIALCRVERFARLRDLVVIGRQRQRTREAAMSDNLGMAAQLAGQSLRFGWYFALNRLVDWRTGQLGLTAPRYKPDPPRAVAAGAAGRPGAAPDERRPGRARRALPAARRRGGLAARAISCACGRCWPTSPPRSAAAPAPTPPTAKAEAAAAGRARLLRAGLPFPDRRLSLGRIGAPLRHPGGDAVHGRRRPHAPHRAAPHRRVHARARPAPASRCSTSPAAPGASCARCGSPIRPCGCRASTCRAPISTRRAVTSGPCAAPS